MAGTIGNENTQDRIPLLFPNKEVGDKKADLGKFLFWLDFADGRLMSVSDTAATVEVAKSRPEALAHAVFKAVDNSDDLPRTQINGVPAVGPSSGLSNHFSSAVGVGPVSEMTFFMVLSKVDGAKPLVKFSSGPFIKTDEVDIGGETGVAYDSTSLGLTIDDELTHIFIIKWDAASGEVYVSVDGDILELLIDSATTAMASPTLLEVGGEGGTGFNGRVGEVMISGQCMDTEEINAVGQYLCNKWKTNWSDLS